MGTRAQLPARPGAARRGDLHGEQVRRERALRRRRCRSDAAPARHRKGYRRAHGRRPFRALATCSIPRSTSATAAGTSGTCSTSTATNRPPSPPTTPVRRTSTAGALRVSASSSRRRALRQEGGAAEEDLRARVRPLTGASASRTSASTTSTGGLKPAARCMTSPSKMTPRKLPICSGSRSDRKLARRLLARACARRSGSPAPSACAGPSAPGTRDRYADGGRTEVDAEPVRILLEDRAHGRLEPVLDPHRVDAIVVPSGELEEEILLRREPVEDGAAGEPDLLLEPDHGRPFVAVAGEAASRAGEDVLPALGLLPRRRSSARSQLYKTVRTYYYRRCRRSPCCCTRPVVALLPRRSSRPPARR